MQNPNTLLKMREFSYLDAKWSRVNFKVTRAIKSPSLVALLTARIHQVHSVNAESGKEYIY